MQPKPSISVSKGSLLEVANLMLVFLLWSGDVEPHPGPRSRKKSKDELVWWNLNTRGAPSVWELLQLAHESHVDVITIQESQMLDNESVALSKKASRYGYTAQMSSGPPTRDRWGHERGKGGVITLISRRISHSHAFRLSGVGGQAIASWINGTFCVNVYVTHSAEQASFLEEVYQHFLAIAVDASFIFICDWNTVPADNAMFALLQDVNGWELSTDEPTRWQGCRKIDYAISNLPNTNMSIRLLPHALSDHRLIDLTSSQSFREVSQIQLQRTFTYVPPDGVSKTIWQSTFESALQVQNSPLHTIPEATLSLEVSSREKEFCFGRHRKKSSGFKTVKGPMWRLKFSAVRLNGFKA